MEAQLSNAIFTSIVGYLEKRGHQDSWKLFATELGVEESWLRNTREWHSAAFLDRLYQVFERHFPQYPNYPFEMTYEAYSESKNPFFQGLAQLLINPETFLALSPRFARRMNHYSDYEYEVLGKSLTLVHSRMRQKCKDPKLTRFNAISVELFRGTLHGIFAASHTPLLEFKIVKPDPDDPTVTEFEFTWFRKRNLSQGLLFLFMAALTALVIGPLGWPLPALLLTVICLPASLLGTAYALVHRRILREQYDYQQKALLDLRQTVSEKDLLNRKLTEFQKSIEQTLTFASVGELSFGVAHDMASPIMLLGLYTKQLNQLLASSSGDPAELAKISQSIELATVRLQRMQQLFRFVAKGTRSTAIVEQDMVETTKNILSLFGPFFDRHQILSVLHAPEHPVILRAPDSALETILLNLIQNAVNALTRMPLTNRNINISILPEPTRTQLTVSDNGPGIPADRRENLWTLFGASQGSTGFGLYSVKKIADRMGATIRVETGSQGTSFHFDFQNNASMTSSEDSPNSGKVTASQQQL